MTLGQMTLGQMTLSQVTSLHNYVYSASRNFAT